MPLDDYPSLCGERAETIVSQDRKNPQKHIARNPGRHAVSQYPVDGVVPAAFRVYPAVSHRCQQVQDAGNREYRLSEI